MLSYRKRKFVARKAPYAKKRPTSYRKSRTHSQFSIRSFPNYFADQPPVLKAKLRYSCQVAANYAAGAPNHYQFCANGLYDPEVAVGGHQPYGFDQLIARYQNATVLYSTCKAQFLQCSENFNGVWKLFAYKELNLPANMWSGGGGANGLNEISVQSKNIVGAANQAIQDDRSTNTLFMNCPKLFGTTAEDMVGDISYQNTASASPGIQCYFGLSGYGAEGVVEDSSHLIQVDIVYWAVFTKPIYYVPS